MRLDGKIALITGGAHGVAGEMMGIGGAAARMFAAEGAAVAIADLNVEMALRSTAEINDDGNRAMAELAARSDGRFSYF